jgi:hypothetical protein
MIPMLAVIRIEPEFHTPIRLWIPLILIWILLAPIALILAPFAIVAAAVCGLNPFKAIWVIGSLFTSMTGTRVEVQGPNANVLIALH